MSDSKQNTKFKLEGSVENASPPRKSGLMLRNSLFTILILALFILSWFVITNQQASANEEPIAKNEKSEEGPLLTQLIDSLEMVLINLKAKYNLNDQITFENNELTFKVVTPPLKFIEDLSTTYEHNIVPLDSSLDKLGIEIAEFYSYTEALKFVEDLRLNGYDEATIVCLKNNEIIPFDEASSKLKEHNK